MRLTAYLAKMFAPAPTPKPTTSVRLKIEYADDT